ncbi:hypothetical protein KEHDKFFH_09710 [Marinobacter maroccanus]|uniref:OmpR/PhoB-type domain-containing protein n=1 Tax=Marinobacter maroccanus TaxID=2055143 RepID=A0A2S5ZAW2_9GAMM|nr:winged helix-turn-helix domain-containing protein [Marinobacter maroccanus]PPI84535.1 hypothetical protein KEHDKFFH_09710 [Marinobacter maroccanus]
MEGQERKGLPDKVYRFGDYLLDCNRDGLSRNGEKLHLEPQVLFLLCYLVEHRDRVVSKGELIETIWQGRVISDAALNTCIRSVRRALGDDSGSQHYLKTYPKRGFRFIGPVNGSGQSEAANNAPVDGLSGASRADDSRNHRAIGAAVLLLLFLFAGLAWWAWPDHNDDAALALPGKPSVAVLKFANLSDDPDQVYFVDGLVEDLITSISLNRELFVISPYSTFRYAAGDVDMDRIGRELGVVYIVRGSVRRTDNRVRISAELIHAPTGATVWSERFDRELVNIFALQDEISRAIAGRLAPEIVTAQAEESRRIPTSSLHAWDLYLQAKALQATFTEENQEEAIRLAGLAIQRDPEFAAPRALIAKAKGIQFFHGWTTDLERTLAEAVQNGRAAIRLDGKDPAGFAALGYVFRLTGDETRALGHLERAKQLNPNDASIRLELAHTLDWFRHQDRALAEIEEAIRLSPRDPRLEMMFFYHAHILFHLGDYSGSLAATDRMAGALTNDTWRTFYHLIRAANFASMDRKNEAKMEVQSAQAIAPQLSIASMRKRFEGGHNHPENRRVWLEALRKAGVPVN